MPNPTIHIFGNPLLPFDNLPLKLKSRLAKQFPDINFITADPNENLKPHQKELVIIDTVVGVKKVEVINDIDKIQLNKMYSLHDFDLGFNLKLLKKIGALKKVTIFAVPPKLPAKEALEQLIELILLFTESKTTRFRESFGGSRNLMSNEPLKNARRRTYRGRKP